MAKRKYTLIDDHGETVGFVVVEQPPAFESAALPHPVEGPAADAVLFVTVLGGFTGAAWLLGGPGWLAPAVGITVTATLAGIKAWRTAAPPETPAGEKPADNVTIQIETWEGDRRLLFDEIRDGSIEFGDWQKVARAVVSEGVNFSRPALSSYVSQTTYHKIKDELVLLQMAHRKGNNYVLSPRGVAFLRKLVQAPALPR